MATRAPAGGWRAAGSWTWVPGGGAPNWAWAEAAKVLEGLPIDFHSTTRALADAAADFKARFKLSLADAFAAALAKERRAELVTGDLEFKALEKEIKVQWLR